MSNENIIEVNNLSKTFNLEAGFFAKNKHNVYAVNDVSFSIKRGTTYNSATYEILFGRTGYEESQSVLKSLKDDQFAIRAVGNKIVITSPKDANLPGSFPRSFSPVWEDPA